MKYIMILLIIDLLLYTVFYHIFTKYTNPKYILGVGFIMLYIILRDGK